MKMVDVRCPLCGTEGEALQRGGRVEPCACGGERERIYKAPEGGAVHQDSIVGGIWIKHGICNEDGTPKRYDSKRDVNAALDKAGLRPLDSQIPVTDDETERNLKRKGYEQTPRIVAMSGVLSPEDEAKRLAHWWAQEKLLQELEK